MSKSQKKDLTKLDALDKMSAAIRLIGREVAFGKIYFPCKANPSIECEVHNGLITQVELTFTNDNRPDRKKRYLSDKN